MAVLAAILPVVSRSSCLALELYEFAASSPGAAKDFVQVAKAINNFALILKQVGTIIKEDDRIPSLEVCYSACSLHPHHVRHFIYIRLDDRGRIDDLFGSQWSYWQEED